MVYGFEWLIDLNWIGVEYVFKMFWTGVCFKFFFYFFLFLGNKRG